jgi:hypothetical protein
MNKKFLSISGFILVCTFVMSAHAEEFDFEFIDSKNYAISYESTNAAVDVTQRPPEEFVFEANGVNGEIHVGLPKTVPRYLHDDSPAIVLLNGHEYADYTESNCFFDYVFPVAGDTMIQFIFAYPPERPLPIYYEDVSEECITEDIPSPLQQFNSGISAVDITCKENMHLVINSIDGRPACATPETKQKLIERGWGSQGSWDAIKVMLKPNKN